MANRIALYYYIGFNNTQCGSAIKDQLVALGVTPNTFVWREGMIDWQQAKFVEELNIVWIIVILIYHAICRLDGFATCKDLKMSLYSL